MSPESLVKTKKFNISLSASLRHNYVHQTCPGYKMTTSNNMQSSLTASVKASYKSVLSPPLPLHLHKLTDQSIQLPLTDVTCGVIRGSHHIKVNTFSYFTCNCINSSTNQNANTVE